jgi:hypothetical protein
MYFQVQDRSYEFSYNKKVQFRIPTNMRKMNIINKNIHFKR